MDMNTASMQEQQLLGLWLSWIEQGFPKAKVVGSSPASPAFMVFGQEILAEETRLSAVALAINSVLSVRLRFEFSYGGMASAT